MVRVRVRVVESTLFVSIGVVCGSRLAPGHIRITRRWCVCGLPTPRKNEKRPATGTQTLTLTPNPTQTPTLLIRQTCVDFWCLFAAAVVCASSSDGVAATSRIFVVFTSN